MDNAIWAGVYGSQGKAVASAAFGRTSGEMQTRADQPTPRGIAIAEGGHMRQPRSRNAVIRPSPSTHIRSRTRQGVRTRIFRRFAGMGGIDR